MCEAQSHSGGVSKSPPLRYQQYTFGLIYPAVLGAFIFGIIERAEGNALLSLYSKNWLSILTVIFFCIEYVELSSDRDGRNNDQKLRLRRAIKHYVILAGIIQMMVSLGAISPLIEWPAITLSPYQLFWLNFGMVLLLIVFSRLYAPPENTKGLSCFGQVKSALAVIGSVFCLIEYSIDQHPNLVSIVWVSLLLLTYIIVLYRQGDKPDFLHSNAQRCKP